MDKIVEIISFSAKPGTTAVLDHAAEKQARSRSQVIMLLIEPHLARLRAKLKSGAKLPRRK